MFQLLRQEFIEKGCSVNKSLFSKFEVEFGRFAPVYNFHFTWSRSADFLALMPRASNFYLRYRGEYFKTLFSEPICSSRPSNTFAITWPLATEKIWRHSGPWQPSYRQPDRLAQKFSKLKFETLKSQTRKSRLLRPKPWNKFLTPIHYSRPPLLSIIQTDYVDREWKTKCFPVSTNSNKQFADSTSRQKKGEPETCHTLIARLISKVPHDIFYLKTSEVLGTYRNKERHCFT